MARALSLPALVPFWGAYSPCLPGSHAFSHQASVEVGAGLYFCKRYDETSYAEVYFDQQNGLPRYVRNFSGVGCETASFKLKNKLYDVKVMEAQVRLQQQHAHSRMH
ncbi:hypothetical protein P7K49_027952 [Saguinus oedipus]|uniref:MHC class II antigen n=1 Tax=Saguinus oedipus TaxID=9490 RepID=A0ABQ9UAX1_SAGOE|nr:hypothetical protein P7K49_027952 [Saguinus oedipus]